MFFPVLCTSCGADVGSAAWLFRELARRAAAERAAAPPPPPAAAEDGDGSDSDEDEATAPPPHPPPHLASDAYAALEVCQVAALCCRAKLLTAVDFSSLF